ncbi:hypothetical protein [Microcoleus sp. FACHB-672]|nr:hypothetical protein [Microcoleus sp. FACHB-672]
MSVTSLAANPSQFLLNLALYGKDLLSDWMPAGWRLPHYRAHS